MATSTIKQIISTPIVYNGRLQDFVENYLPTLSLESNKIYSVRFQDPNWDIAYGWCMRIGQEPKRHVAQLSNANGYHLWASDASGLYKEFHMGYVE